MTLPVSNYEELLDQVRELTNESILIHEQLSSDLYKSIESSDVNHNLARIQKNYQRGIELADSVIKQCEQAQLETSQPLPLAGLSPPTLQPKVPENLGVVIKIPPGDPTSRLNAWREKQRLLTPRDSKYTKTEKNRLRLMLHQAQLHDSDAEPQRLGNDEDDEDLARKERRLQAAQRKPPAQDYVAPTKHAAKDISQQSQEGNRMQAGSVFGASTGSIASSWSLSGLPGSVEPLNIPDSPRRRSLQTELSSPSRSLSTPESYCKSGQIYDLDGSSTEDDSRPGSSLQSQQLPKTHGVWPVKRDLWGLSQPAGLPAQQISAASHNDLSSIMSFSSGAGISPTSGMQGQRRLGAKMDVVYSLLSMLGSTEGREDMSATLLSMSSSVDSCIVMRQSGCLPLLIQLIHAPGQDPETRERASRALYNIVHAKNDEKMGRREARVLRLLEQLRDYCQSLRSSLETRQPLDDLERHPGATIAALMKLSFDESHRHAMCQLGGLHAVAELIEMDHTAHGSDSDDQNCITLRRYAGMALTNLTFGDSNNKALLCSFQDFMKALVSQLRSPSDDLRQVTASVLRNLSWRADSSSKQTLREVGAVIGLMRAAMEGRKESTLKSILSALWNLSAHCSTNKMDICAVEGALAFLVDMLSYNAPSKTLAIVENAGGILRNVSSHIAVRDDYRSIVRERGCLQVLLRQLKSPSLTVVSNACGALWNLSARCPQDQRLLWELGAVPMLRSLVHSKHKMISMGSSAALKNLLSARPNGSNLVHLDSTARGLGLPTLPSLMARRQKALEQEIDQTLSETCDNIEPSTSPVNKDDKFSFDQSFLNPSSKTGRSFQQLQIHPSAAGHPSTSGMKYSGFPRSDSRESMRSVTSTHSDTVFEKVNRQARNGVAPLELQFKQQSASLHSAINFDAGNSTSKSTKGSTEKKYTLRYMNVIPERLKPGEPLPDLRGLNYTPSTISWSASANHDSSCSKGLMHSSIEDNLSMSNSCESSNSKAGVNSESSSSNFSGTRAKSTSPFNGVANYNLPLKSIQKVISPTNDAFNDYAETDLDQPTDYSLKYAENTSDDDKQSSAYFTSTEQEQDTLKTYCTEGTPYQGSLNSSRASSTSDMHDENRTRPHLRKITNELRYSSGIPVQKYKRESQIPDNISSRSSSVRSVSTSDNTLTLEAGRSLESDSAIFEGDHKLGESSGVPSLSSLAEDEPKIINESKNFSKAKELNGDENENHNLRNNGLTFKKNSYIKELPSENNLVRYKTNASLNDIEIQDINDDMLSGNQTTPLTSLESDDQQQQDDGDFSEITCTNDYYTVQETYTLEKKVQKTDDNTILNDDYSISQQCSSTLSYMSVDDKDFSSNLGKKKFDLTDNATENMKTTVCSNSASCESFNSIERSEQVLLELCIKTGVSKPESQSSTEINAISVAQTEDVIDTSKQTIFSASSDAIYKTASNSSQVTGKSQEEYRRQRDPDAMIASLDRLTAALVQQTEAMRERDSSTMKASLLSDTWNEDSLNEVSFPSISVSAPLVASFKSDLQEDHVTIATQGTDEDCSNLVSMTDSKIIEIEANKLAEAVKANANDVSLASLDLDAINPPSTMGSLISLTASIGGITENGDNSGEGSRGNSLSLPQFSMGRKKSLPIGVVARRALSHGQNRTGSLENLLNECNSNNHSQLENMKPPSIMDEILDVGDMENSMLSVASITSEIADAKDNDSNSLTSSDPVFDLIKPMANALSMTCLKYAETMQGSGNNSLSECLENINPPSLFNEVSQMDESTMDANTQCSDTLCIDADIYSEEATHFVFDERIEEIANDTDDAATPLSSEYCSSAESTPKKRPHKNHTGQLTPKQKRQLAKERYKTYTIAAERVRKEEEDRKRQEQMNDNGVNNVTGKSPPFSKLTPKQRRQEDRARFQTQVLDTQNIIKLTNEEVPAIETTEKPSVPEKTGIQSLVKTGIPMLRKYSSGSKTFRINKSAKQESKETNRINTEEVTTAKNYDERETLTQCVDKIQNLNEENANTLLNLENANTIPDEPATEETAQETAQVKLTNGISKKLNSIPTEPSSETEVANKDYVIENKEDSDESESSSDSDSEKEEERKIKGPRIVKPGTLSRDLSVESNATDQSEPDIPKGIRGRRKPLYSTPNTRKSTPQSSPLKQPTAIAAPSISRSNTSPIVRATRATTLRQNNSSQKINVSPRTSANNSGAVEKRPASANNAAKRSSIPQKGGTSAMFSKVNKRFSTPANSGSSSPKAETPIKPLERQGTFTKDEPEMENVPTVLPMSPCKVPRPADTATKLSPKTSPVHAKSKISVKTTQKPNLMNLTKTTSADKISTPTGIPTFAKRATTNLGSPVVKSSSNYQIGSTNESGIPRKISLGPRSNSNSSILSNTSAQGTRNKVVKETTSKIASLWKKVEENKNKQMLNKPDTRQWITPNRTAIEIDSSSNDKDETCRLVRSSTFEGIANDTEGSSQDLIST